MLGKAKVLNHWAGCFELCALKAVHVCVTTALSFLGCCACAQCACAQYAIIIFQMSPRFQESLQSTESLGRSSLQTFPEHETSMAYEQLNYANSIKR